MTKMSMRGYIYAHFFKNRIILILFTKSDLYKSLNLTILIYTPVWGHVIKNNNMTAISLSF